MNTARHRRHGGLRGLGAMVVLLAFAGCAGMDAGRLASERASPEVSAPPGWITFTGRNLFRSVDHTFTRWRFVQAEISSPNGDGTGLSGELEVEIDLASVETGSERLNRQARSERFFDVARYPTARLWIGDVESLDREAPSPPTYEAVMEIEVRGLIRRQRMTFTVRRFDPLIVSGEVMLRRSDFGIGPPYRWFNPFSIRDEVTVRFETTLPG